MADPTEPSGRGFQSRPEVKVSAPELSISDPTEVEELARWGQSIILCSCDEAYTSRGRTAPDCAWHEGALPILEELLMSGWLARRDAALLERATTSEKERDEWKRKHADLLVAGERSRRKNRKAQADAFDEGMAIAAEFRAERDEALKQRDQSDRAFAKEHDSHGQIIARLMRERNEASAERDALAAVIEKAPHDDQCPRASDSESARDCDCWKSWSRAGALAERDARVAQKAHQSVMDAIWCARPR